MESARRTQPAASPAAVTSANPPASSPIPAEWEVAPSRADNDPVGRASPGLDPSSIRY
jgi:hypothetical protein